MAETLSNTHIANFYGMDASRNTTFNVGYGIGVLAINNGRELKSPLEARFGLRPTTSSNNASEFGGLLHSFAMFAQGTRIHALYRVDGGKVLTAKNVKPKEYVTADLRAS